MNEQKPKNAYEEGMQTRKTVLGEAHVARAEALKTDFDHDFQAYIVDAAWQKVWSRPHLSKRERSMLTIALLAALGHDEELAMHFRASKNTGCNIQDIKEVLLHTAVYAGIPAANHAFKIAKQTLNEQQES